MVIPVKQVVITGANAGIGLATARQLAASHELILLCRTARKAAEAKRQVIEFSPRAVVTALAMDLHRFESVKAAAAAVLQHCASLDVLINNAGYFPEKIEYVGEVEKTLYASHLGHMLLTWHLLPLLEKSADARIINVSSALHGRGRYQNLFRRVPGLTPFQAYVDAKLANVIFTKALAARTKPSVCSFSLHPGVVATGFDRGIQGWFKTVIDLSKPLFFISPAAGAATSVWLATEPRKKMEGHNGGYFSRSRPAPIRHAAVTAPHAEAFWNRSMQLLDGFLP